MTYYRNWLIMKYSKPANHRRIVCDSAIPVDFVEIVKKQRHIVEQIGPIRVAR